MSRLLIVGDPIATLTDQGEVTDGAVIVDGQRIVDVGPRVELEQAGPFDRVLGSADHFVLPGFVNCHYHSELALGPGLYQYLFERANVQVHAAMGPIDEQDLYTGILWGLITALKGGQTGFVDMYYGRPSLADFGCEAALTAYEDLGLRTAFGLVSRDRNRYVHAPDAAFLDTLPDDLAASVDASPMGYAWDLDRIFDTFDATYRAWHGRDERIRIIVAPDWTPACSDELYRRCVRIATDRETGLATHAQETRAEMVFNLKTHGMSGVRRLHELGVLAPNTVLEHFVWVTDDDLAIFANSGAVASNNPGSNLRLSTGICRVRDILRTGGRVAFGTDGISFSDEEDFFEELRLACYLQRTPHDFDVGRLDSRTVLTAAARNGARALGREGELGAVAPGYLADLVVVDKQRIFFPPSRYAHTPFLDVVLDRARATDIDDVIVNGQIVLEAGEVTFVDEDRVREQFAAGMDRRVHEMSDAVREWIRLGEAIDPHVTAFFESWYDLPVQPAHVYNPRTDPDLSVLAVTTGARVP